MLQLTFKAREGLELVRYTPYLPWDENDRVQQLKKTYQLTHTSKHSLRRPIAPTHQLPGTEGSTQRDFTGVIFYDFQNKITVRNHFTMACKEPYKSLTTTREAYKAIFINNKAYKKRFSKVKSLGNSSRTAAQPYGTGSTLGWMWIGKIPGHEDRKSLRKELRVPSINDCSMK